MKLVSKYQTVDGKMFDSKDEAKGHENYIKAFQAIDAILRTSLQSGRPDSVIKHLLYEHSEIRAILAKYAHTLPKEEKVAA